MSVCASLPTFTSKKIIEADVSFYSTFKNQHFDGTVTACCARGLRPHHLTSGYQFLLLAAPFLIHLPANATMKAVNETPGLELPPLTRETQGEFRLPASACSSLGHGSHVGNEPAEQKLSVSLSLFFPPFSLSLSQLYLLSKCLKRKNVNTSY